MKYRNRQNGFTLLELAVVGSIISLLVIFLTGSLIAKLDQYNLDETIGNGKRIAETADRYRKMARTTTRGANGVVTYTKYRYPSGITAQAFNNANGTNLPTRSAYNTPYIIFVSDHITRVRVDVPLVVTPIGVNSTPLAGSQTRLEMYPDISNLGRSDEIYSLLWEKRNLYLEEVNY